MKKILLLLSVITLTYASVGKISAIRGDAVVISKGNEIKALLNQELDESDIIKTGNNARLQIIFNDNTVTTLGKNTSLEIKQFLLDGKNSKVNLEVSEGSFKVITGEISKLARKNFSLKAHTATIGIRGTVFVGEVGLNINKLACLQGAIDVKLGNKTSLIDSGKQISFSNTKIIKVEPLKVNDFSLTKANINEDNKPEKIQEKQEDKQSTTNTNKVTSITLSSDIKAENTNSNSKNTLQTSEQMNIASDIKEEVTEIIAKNDNSLNTDNVPEIAPNKPSDDLVIPSNPNTTPDTPSNPDNNTSTPENKPNDNNVAIPDVPVIKDEKEWTKLEPSIPNKYFANNNVNSYYYYSEDLNSKSAASLNLGTMTLDLYGRKLENDKSVKSFDYYTLDGKKNTLTSNSYNVSDLGTKEIKTQNYNLQNTSLNTPNAEKNLEYSSDYASFSANKNELKAKLIGINYDLSKSDLSHFTTLKDDWNSFKSDIEKNNQTAINYYSNTNSAAELDLSRGLLTYYSKEQTKKDGRDSAYNLRYFVMNHNYLQMREYDIEDLEYNGYTMNFQAPTVVDSTSDHYRTTAYVNKEQIEYTAKNGSLDLNILNIKENLKFTNSSNYRKQLADWDNEKTKFFTEFYTNPAQEFYYADTKNNYVKLKPSDSYFASYSKINDTSDVLFELQNSKLLGVYNKNNVITRINPQVNSTMDIDNSQYKLKIDSNELDKTSIKLETEASKAKLQIESKIANEDLKIKTDELKKSLNISDINKKINEIKNK
ncbi:FecR domain-containing protein [Campylobacter sp. 2018MI01]|uniref:FecR family protein n=1 Tax=Campylobacter sp. 2018MI01 TaxID=2836735 RepID=UPI001BDA337D|nr:FecR family protein [Campylobacter sp. 2018MI01]MBT0878088.1 FecR domain-containing protein [Campylobacter sp. 2018MI01]